VDPGAPIVSSCPRPRSIETRSLRLGVSGSLVIAAAGLVAYGLSGAEGTGASALLDLSLLKVGHTTLARSRNP
jgi:hypothetical protein